MKPPLVLTALALSCTVASAALGQTVTNGLPTTTNGKPMVVAPPSVDNGVANGVAKPSGAPSVGNGVANGVVKQPGAPSVGNGVANGVSKSTTMQQ